MLQSANLVQPPNMMGSLLYRSTALQRPTESELGKLIRASQRRNRALGITGMLVYQNGHYLQSLEGPPDAMEEVWSSIRRDPRHCSIQVLKQTLTPGRMFSGWDMKLLRRAPEDTPERQTNMQAIERLKDQVPHVARLALGGDEAALTEVIEDFVARGWPAGLLIQGLLEPAARALGDAWLSDDCMDIDVTIGLGALRLASRMLRHAEGPRANRGFGNAKVLIAAAPGEPHMLGACLMADAFMDAGWPTEFAFPDSDSALASDCQTFQPAVIVVALSDAMPRTGALTTLEKTVAACRKACRGRDVIISVCGRTFAEGSASAGQVGADHARHSAADMPASIAGLLASKSAAQGKKPGGAGRDMH